MRTPTEQSLSRPLDSMADRMSYSATNHYSIPAHTQYYPTPHANHGHGHVHIVSPPPRQETTQRKRPKYTRSKTGCLTCRVKKIKCDETKPNCMRCTHGQRDCTWPEGVPARKKSVVRKDSADGRPSTAGSSGISEGSTPPTREPTPPRRPPIDLGILPLASRRSEPYLQGHSLSSEAESGRRQILNGDRAPAYTHNPKPNGLSMIPEAPSYSQQGRYEHSYSNGAHSSSRNMSTGFRSLSHQHATPWNQPPESMEYFSGVPERALVGHSSMNDSHNRYQ